MNYTDILSDAFDGICLAFELRDYEQVSVLVAYLELLTEYMTDTQIEQLTITKLRLGHLAKEHKCQETQLNF